MHTANTELHHHVLARKEFRALVLLVWLTACATGTCHQVLLTGLFSKLTSLKSCGNSYEHSRLSPPKHWSGSANLFAAAATRMFALPIFQSSALPTCLYPIACCPVVEEVIHPDGWTSRILEKCLFCSCVLKNPHHVLNCTGASILCCIYSGQYCEHTHNFARKNL